MLVALTIRDVVLIDRLDLGFGPGLCVLTGETGAGKSILLDALGLALGQRAESALVRAGATQASVTARFAPPSDHPVWALLSENGIAEDEDSREVVLRRVLGADGRSRAFVNDEPVSIALLRRAAETLVEIQGQFEQRGLMDEATHRAVLDLYGGHQAAVGALAAAWRRRREAAAAREAAEAEHAAARREEDYLRHALAELDAIEPKPGEEAALAERRALLMHREKLVQAVEGALAEIAGDKGAARALAAAARQLDRVRERAGDRLALSLAALERAEVEAREATAQLEAALSALASPDDRLDAIEERLFALRGLARKHGVAVDELAALRTRTAERVAGIETGGDAIARLRREEEAAAAAYREAAERLTEARVKTVRKLDAAVAKELPPLKLDKARFRTVLSALPETQWGEHGKESVAFEVATNPGAAPGPLARIASGGELSRFMLALKLVLAKTSPVRTLVFDEVDSGIGGAVAAAVGERLQRLGRELQVLVVTHSPQVAAMGAQHLRVVKDQGRQRTATRVDELDAKARREEIARMLSGAAVTAEARAAADSLIAAGAAR